MKTATTGSEIHATQHGSFELGIAAAEAFPLFSPEGERIWVPGWDPTPIFPDDDVVRWQTDAVFSIIRDGELLTWWTVDVDREDLRADYFHFSTGRAVRVTVQLESTGTKSCRVNVTYLITATTPEGERHVRNACSMQSRMDSWKSLIETALPSGEVPAICR
jgi:hypothetical protein